MRITIWVTLVALALVILFATFLPLIFVFSALFFSPVAAMARAGARNQTGFATRCAKVSSLRRFWPS